MFYFCTTRRRPACSFDHFVVAKKKKQKTKQNKEATNYSVRNFKAVARQFEKYGNGIEYRIYLLLINRRFAVSRNRMKIVCIAHIDIVLHVSIWNDIVFRLVLCVWTWENREK